VPSVFVSYVCQAQLISCCSADSERLHRCCHLLNISCMSDIPYIEFLLWCCLMGCPEGHQACQMPLSVHRGSLSGNPTQPGGMWASTRSAAVTHYHHHHHGWVASEGCHVVAPPCPQSTAHLQRCPVGWVESFRSWLSHLFCGRPGGRRHVRSGGHVCWHVVVKSSHMPKYQDVSPGGPVTGHGELTCACVCVMCCLQ